jgi:hypothetical protein
LADVQVARLKRLENNYLTGLTGSTRPICPFPDERGKPLVGHGRLGVFSLSSGKAEKKNALRSCQSRLIIFIKREIVDCMTDKYQMIRKLAEPYLRTRMNAIHTELSAQFAFRLLELEDGDEDIVIPAILLHDVGWSQVPEELQLKAFGPKATLPEWNRVHEVEGVRIARGILEKIAYDSRKIEEILAIIEGHDSRKEGLSLNDKLVKDADKLWRYSKEGVEINRRRYDYSFDQYLERLRGHLDVWFLTGSGRQLAEMELEKRILEGRALSCREK